MKLLVAGIIYPTSNNQWVSLVQVVPKKFGITIVKNQNNELVPSSVQNSWREPLAPTYLRAERNQSQRSFGGIQT
ncbi:hypothetical protein CR513_18814, partial [Mucuna pruriens]